jgi:hypothetical protein
MCHVGQEPDSSRTLDARIALLKEKTIGLSWVGLIWWLYQCYVSK